MNCSLTNHIIEKGFQLYNNKMPNASLLNYINKDRLIFARIYEVLLQNYIERWIHVKYNIPVHLKSQQQYYSMDYISNKNVYVELKTLRHTTFEKYECIDLLSYHEYTIFKNALNDNPNTLCFVFIYFAENNTLYFCRIMHDTPYEEGYNVFQKYCCSIKTDNFTQINLETDFRLFL